MEPTTLFSVFSFFFLLTISILTFRHQYSEGYDIIQKWADREGHRVLCCQLRSFRRGSFTLKETKHQNVYYIVVADKRGKQRSGFACCGGFRNGVKSEHIAFRWDKTGR